ncbi:extracellular solute-binding protein [Coralliovum pocilloporae]|uniref:extracellular solute-binding protein n=1 Tax=Coralliovum pocilloporae TaxID=3066369 RepID=UPI003306AE35
MFKLAKPFFIALGLTVLSVTALPVTALAEEPEWRHATALTGTPKYPRDFKRFDYANPDAPKGGLVRQATSNSFDTFNPILQKGSPTAGLNLIYETLMTSSLDELDISAAYGQIALETRYPKDYSWVEFRLNPKARWHDGQPITAEDVIWSFEKAIEHNQGQRAYYHNVTKAEVLATDVVRFTFDGPDNRELPHIMGQVLVLPKHWWEGTNAKGEQRSIGKSTLEIPLGSGPYRMKEFVAGRSVTYERVPDYWGKDLPVTIGHYNFDQIRYDVYLDQTVLVEAFKGDQYDFRTENSAKNWATQYKFKAAEEGKVIQEAFDDKASGAMQAFVLNLRLDKFKDPRVRRALNLAFDFEALAETIFFGQYQRTGSYFAGTELAASDVPTGLELEILEGVRGEVPEQLFSEPYTNPVGGSPRNVRNNLHEAVKLLKEAGWVLKSGKLVNAKTGEPFTIEFVDNSPSTERIALPYQSALKRIGIEMTLRIVDTSQYINRIRSRDFEMTTLGWGQSLSPGNEQREYWGSVAADSNSSRNYAGIKNPAIDKLIDRVIFAKDRAELVAATKALDRVLLWNNYMVPQWYVAKTRTVRWNRFSHPENLPEYNHGFPHIWWYDEEKARKTGLAR